MQRILIVPHKPELDALIARLVEALEYQPLLLTSDQAPVRAVERVGPAVVMMDADNHWRGDPALGYAAQRAGAPIILFSGSRSLAELRELAAAQGVGHFLLPNGPRALACAIGEALLTLRRDDVGDATARIARCVRLAAHHQERVRWHQSLVSRVATEVDRGIESKKALVTSREALRRAQYALREAVGQLRGEIMLYAQQRKTFEVAEAALVAEVGSVVHDALDDSPARRDRSPLEAQVEQWCLEAYNSAA